MLGTVQYSTIGLQRCVNKRWNHYTLIKLYLFCLDVADPLNIQTLKFFAVKCTAMRYSREHKNSPPCPCVLNGLGGEYRILMLATVHGCCPFRGAVPTVK